MQPTPPEISIPALTPQRTARLKRLQQASGWATEAVNASTVALDKVPVSDALSLLSQADAEAVQAVKQARPQLAALIEAIAARFRQHPDSARLIYVGAGTSGRLGVLDAAECVPTFGLPVGRVVGVMAGGYRALHSAVEGAEDDAEAAIQDLEALKLTDADTVIGISASGKAAYVKQALEEANKAGCLTGSLTNHAASPLLSGVDYPVLLDTGAEVITGSTRMKAGTAQKLALNAISTLLMVQTGRTYGNVMVDVQPTNAKLRERAARMVAALANVDVDLARQKLIETAYSVKQAVLLAAGLAQSPSDAAAKLTQADGRLGQVLDNDAIPSTLEADA